MFKHTHKRTHASVEHFVSDCNSAILRLKYTSATVFVCVLLFKRGQQYIFSKK